MMVASRRIIFITDAGTYESQGSGVKCWFQSYGSEVQGLGCKIRGFGFEVWGLGSGV